MATPVGSIQVIESNTCRCKTGESDQHKSMTYEDNCKTLEAVNSALSATVQKQEADIKNADRRIATLCRLIREMAEVLDRAGYRQTAENARDAAL